MSDREWCILHSSLCIGRDHRSLCVVCDWGQFLLWLGFRCPRHRAILRQRFGFLDCRLSRGQWHWFTGDIWGYGYPPPQVCERCGATVGREQ